MPARSNEFQQLIYRIYDHLKPSGAKITESKMVLDQESEIDREIDICIEAELADHKVTFMVECRDHGRKQGIEWVEQVISKARALQANKIIMIASNGFTAPAKKKAHKHGIELYTLVDAKDEDWSKFLVKPGVTLIGHEQYSLLNFSIYYGDDEELLESLDLSNELYIDNEYFGSFEDFLRKYFSEVLVRDIDNYLTTNIKNIFKNKADFEKELMIELTRDFQQLHIKADSLGDIIIRKIKFLVKGKRNAVDVELTHKKYMDSMFSFGEREVSGVSHDVMIKADEDGNINGNIKITKTKEF
jgi:hypothetical protein